MESPRTGIVILLLVAVFSLAGALLGWQLRPPAAVSAPPALPVENASDQSGGFRPATVAQADGLAITVLPDSGLAFSLSAGVRLSENRGLEMGGYRKTGDILGAGFDKSN